MELADLAELQLECLVETTDGCVPEHITRARDPASLYFRYHSCLRPYKQKSLPPSGADKRTYQVKVYRRLRGEILNNNFIYDPMLVKV